VRSSGSHRSFSSSTTRSVVTSSLNRAEAAGELGLTRSQLTRLHADEDIFSLDRLVDAATAIGLIVRMTATRPYG